MPDEPRAPVGARLHLDRRALVCFCPPVHPEKATRHGPLARGSDTFTSLGPDRTRDAVHLARLPYDAALNTWWVVSFHPDEAR